MKVLAIIPARYESSRLPGKPLATLGDKTMIQRVYENAINSNLFSKVIVATDDQRIANECIRIKANFQMTNSEHQSGTNRCAEVLEKQPENYDVIINIQGDEPFIDPSYFNSLLSIFKNEKVEIGTLYHTIKDPFEVLDPNCVKVVLSKKNKALYFSRAQIPYIRNKALMGQNDLYKKHIGLYAYKPQVLKEIPNLGFSILEDAEKLEQLNWLEHGYEIYASEIQGNTISIDTMDDLEKAREFLLQKTKN